MFTMPRELGLPVSSRQHMKKVIADIEIGDVKIRSASEMAEAFNCHFANIGHDLARDIPSTDTIPERYLISTNPTFSFKNCSSNEVRKLLEKLETKKLTGLDIDWIGQFATQDA